MNMYFRNYVEQQEQNIAAWLGSSTVKQPVYHGTNARFQEFKKMPAKRGVLFTMFDVQAQGFFFSESKEDAKRYGTNIITAYVRLTKPLLDPRRDGRLGIDKLSEEQEVHLAYILRQLIQKDPHYGKYIDQWVSRVYVPGDFAIKGNYEWIYHFIGSGGLIWDVLDEPTVNANMKKFGYDGTFVHEPDDEIGRSIYVMSPDQVLIV
jgi:hypothetical protein